MPSTINGNAGVAASGLFVAALPVDSRGALIGLPIQALVAGDGSYVFGGLNAGTYIIQPLTGTEKITQGSVTVDGSSTYNI